MVQHIDRIELFRRLDRPAPRLIALDQSNEHVESVALFRTFRRAPAGFDLGERGAMVLVVADRPDVDRSLHQYCDTVSASTLSYSACVPMNFTKTIWRRKSKAATTR